jgi:hypothetical protein
VIFLIYFWYCKGDPKKIIIEKKQEITMQQIEIISNLIHQDSNDYMEHAEFVNDINKFLSENENYQLYRFFNLGDELIAILITNDKDRVKAKVMRPQKTQDEILKEIQKNLSLLVNNEN